MTLIIHLVAILHATFQVIPLVQCLSVDVFPRQATLHQDDSITIRCTADQGPEQYDNRINYTWFHYDDVIAVERVVTDTDKYFVSMEGETASILRIASITPRDKGAYTCMAVEEGTGSIARSSSDITVWYPPAVHFPTCFFQNTNHGIMSAIPEGTSVTFVCSSDTANPLPIISWFRSDTVPAKYVGGTIVMGESYVRNEMTVIIGQEFQGATFECRLQSPAFPSFDQSCSIGPITVKTTKIGVNPTQVNPTRVFAAGFFPTESVPTESVSDGHDSDSKQAAEFVPSTTSTVLSTTDPSMSQCKTSLFSFADRALVPVSVILTILLLISIVIIILQRAKILHLSVKRSNSNIASVRHDVKQEDCYMAINQESVARPSTYTELNTRSSMESVTGAGDYEQYDMPGECDPTLSNPPMENQTYRPAYEDMTRNSPELARQSLVQSPAANQDRQALAPSRSMGDSPKLRNSPNLNQERPPTRVEGSPKLTQDRPPTPPRTWTLDNLCQNQPPVAPYRTKTGDRPCFGDRKRSLPEQRTQLRPTLQTRSLSHNAHELARELQQVTPLPPIPHTYERTISGMSVQ